MKFYSPLRYPGGKSKLADFVAKICDLNNIHGHYVEPYAGGASVALFLLLEGKVSKVTINDKDRAIYAFWYSILNHTDEFIGLIKQTRINITNWRKFRKVVINKESTGLLELGFATFFLNRTNVSGILNGGPIGNIHQTGAYKINCRFNKAELIRRIMKIAEHKGQINVTNLDALDVIKAIDKQSRNLSTIFYFDPPYYIKGESLYLNSYGHDDHKKVGEAISRIENIHWIVSYDDTKAIREIYKGIKTKKHSLLHSAYKPRVGKEILFFSSGLLVPRLRHTV